MTKKLALLCLLIGCSRGGAAPRPATATKPVAPAPAPIEPPLPAYLPDQSQLACGTKQRVALAHYHDAGSKFDRGDLAGATAAYEASIALDPKFCDALDNLAVIYRRLDRLDDAIALYERWIAVAPDNLIAWQNIGVAYRMKGRDADALRAYQQLTVLAPDNPEGWFGLAQLAILDSKWTDGLEAARHAEALYIAQASPLVADARLLIGTAAMGIPDWPLVRSTLEPMYDQLSDNPAVNFSLGAAYLEAEPVDKAKAKKDLTRAREFGIPIPPALWKLAQ